ncbi:phage/plasmid replication protein, II/X family [Bacterioplanoides sp.]|uniref:phage/plasmid replication protein, II/X family n=1 Tax=Bacterioplanoides sp. TaxID=2066072 RepID=UPI003B5AB323
MIDRLVIHIPFQDKFVVNGDSDDTGIMDVAHLLNTEATIGGRNVNRTSSGEVKVEDLYHPYESIPSWASGMAVKSFTRPVNAWPYVELKASPAKLLQGHNVYGTEDYKKCLFEMLGLLAVSFPKLNQMLNVESGHISSFDVTYSVKAPTQQIADHFIKYCSSLRSGQTKSREQYPTTVYFGKRDSRHKKLKIYLKHYELKNYVSELKKKNSDGSYDEAIKINSSNDLLDYTLGLIRFEATIKKRWLMERAIPVGVFKLGKYAKSYFEENKRSIWKQIHEDAFRDLFKTFEGGQIMDYSDEHVLDLLKSKHSKINKNGSLNHSVALRAFRFYRSIASEGYDEIHATTPSSTFYRQIGHLKKAGIPLANLQNLHKIKSNVVPVIQLIKMDYGKQHPATYQEPESGLSRPKLSLVS